MFDYINKFHLNKKKCILTNSDSIAEKKSGMSTIFSAQNNSIQQISIWGGKQTQVTLIHILKTKRDQNAKEMEYNQSCHNITSASGLMVDKNENILQWG